MTSSLVGSEMCIRDSQHIDCTLLRQDHSKLLMIQLLLGSEDDRRELPTTCLLYTSDAADDM
eukprot:1266501-Prorocentrum_lima.AAC.1